MIRHCRGNYPMDIHINETRPNEDFFVREMGYSCPPAGYRTRNVLSPMYAIHFVSKGCGTYNNQHIDASCGFLIAVNEPYSFKFDERDPWEHYWICVGGTKAPDILASMGMPPHNHIFACDWFDKVQDEFHRMIFEDDLPMDPSTYMLGIFYKTMSYHVDRSAARPEIDRAERYCMVATQYIQDNYFSRITVDDVAAAANISSKYLYKLFIARFGMPPSVYLANYRLDRAKQLLTDTSLPISEIARSVGYEQPNYFTNAFRGHFGISPSVFREDCKTPRSN